MLLSVLTMWSLPSWSVNLEVASFCIAIVAIALSIWERARVRFWERFGPLTVRFERDIVVEQKDLAIRPAGEPSVFRIRFSVRSRVDYRTEVLLGAALSDALYGSCDQELCDQIDEKVLASTKVGRDLRATVEAFQSRHLTQRMILRGTGSGTIVPSVTFLVGRPGHSVPRVATWKSSVSAHWIGRKHEFRVVPTEPLPGSRKRDLVGW